MHGHCRIKLGFGRATCHGDAEKLRHFPCPFARDMAAENDIGFAINNQLHKGAFIAARKSVLHGAEAGFVDVNVGMCGAGLGFGEADQA